MWDAEVSVRTSRITQVVFTIVCGIDNSNFGGQRWVTNETYTLWLLWVLEGSSKCMSNFLRMTVGCFLDQVPLALCWGVKTGMSVRRGGVRLQRGLRRHICLKVVFTICYGVSGSISHQRIQICIDNFQEFEHSPQTKLQWKPLPWWGIKLWGTVSRKSGAGAVHGVKKTRDKREWVCYLILSVQTDLSGTSVVSRAEFWELSSLWIKMTDDREEKESALRVQIVLLLSHQLKC